MNYSLTTTTLLLLLLTAVPTALATLYRARDDKIRPSLLAPVGIASTALFQPEDKLADPTEYLLFDEDDLYDNYNSTRLFEEDVSEEDDNELQWEEFFALLQSMYGLADSEDFLYDEEDDDDMYDEEEDTMEWWMEDFDADVWRQAFLTEPLLA